MSRRDIGVAVPRAEMVARSRDRARTTCLVALVASGAFAAYLSWVPFNFHAVTGGLLIDRAREAHDPHVTSRTNFLANIVLFVPFGLFGAGAFRLDGRSWASGGRWTGVLLLCSFFTSLTIESLQMFLPGRTPAMSDVIAQSAGTTVGLVSWLLIGSDLLAWSRRRRDGGGEPAVMLLQVVVACLIVGALFPLDVTMSFSTLARKFREGRIILIPFQDQTFANGLAQEIASGVSFAMPLGALAVLGWTIPGRRRGILAAILASICVVAMVEMCQVVVMSRVADVSDILTGAAGAAIGACLAARLSGSASTPVRGRSLTAPAGLAVSVLLYTLSSWSPFDFTWSKTLLEQRWPELMQVPFYAYYARSEIQASADFVAKFCLTLPVGLFTGIVISRTHHELRRLHLVTASILAAILFVTIEVGQIFLPSRFPDVTDVLIGMLGFGLGMALPATVRRWRRHSWSAFE
jgi:glycopeptide antibiotics resistance protein